MATKQIAWNTGSGNITLTYTGHGDGPVTIQSDANDGAARSQIITIETTAGSPVITKNLTVRQGACPVPVGTVLNYAYTGNYQEVELPAGTYQLQVWGAQGGSNATDSTYGITAKAGGKGGYSVGQLTISQTTIVRVYVGGEGGSQSGGYNGGGGVGQGRSYYDSGSEVGTTRYGGGGGASDIRLSDGSLYSRMIVAGGGSGGAMACRVKTVEVVSWETLTINAQSSFQYEGVYYTRYQFVGLTAGMELKIVCSGTNTGRIYINDAAGSHDILEGTNYYTAVGTNIWVYFSDNNSSFTSSCTASKKVTSTSTETTNFSQVGYVGGGTSGGGDRPGIQNNAGYGAGFGNGSSQQASTYRYCSGAGGGGWYGGGRNWSNTSTDAISGSGGGSGWVNTAASAGNRPSGYNSLQLDSGETKDGNTSFPAPDGSNETGHAGNGYARITRLS